MINVKMLIEPSSTAKKTFVGLLDARIKLLYSILILIWTFIIDDLFSLSILLILSSIVAINVGSLTDFVSLIWSLKWLIILIVGFNILFLGVNDVAYYINLIFSLIILIVSFSVFNRSTSPDELLDALLKLKVPKGIAWRVSLSLRQAIFFIDEYSNIIEIQRKRLKIQELGLIKSNIRLAAVLITTMFSISIVRAGELSNALRARGFREIHSDMVFNTSEIKNNDVLFMILLLITLIPLLFISSQLFI